MSVTMMSKWTPVSWSFAKADVAESVTVTVAPSSFSVSATTVRASGSSSTTRIDKPPRLACVAGAVGRHGAAVQGHNLAHERQAQTQPPGLASDRAVTLAKAIKYVGQQLR